MEIDLQSGLHAARVATHKLATELDGNRIVSILEILPHLKDILGAVADQKIALIIAAFDGDYSLIEQVASAMQDFDTEHLDDFDLGFQKILAERLTDKCLSSR